MALHSGYKPDEHPNSTQLKHQNHLETHCSCDYLNCEDVLWPSTQAINLMSIQTHVS